MSRINYLDHNKNSGSRIFSGGSSITNVTIVEGEGVGDSVFWEVEVGEGKTFPTIQSAINAQYSKIYISGNTTDNILNFSKPVVLYIDNGVTVSFQRLSTSASSIQIIGSMLNTTSSTGLSKLNILDSSSVSVFQTANNGFISFKNLQIDTNTTSSINLIEESSIKLLISNVKLMVTSPNFKCNISNSTLNDLTIDSRTLSLVSDYLRLNNCIINGLTIYHNRNSYIGTIGQSQIHKLLHSGSGQIDFTNKTLIDNFEALQSEFQLRWTLANLPEFSNGLTLSNGNFTGNCELFLNGDDITLQNLKGVNYISMSVTNRQRLKLNNIVCTNLEGVSTEMSIQDLTLTGNDPLLISSSNSIISNLKKPLGLITISGNNNRCDNFNCHSMTVALSAENNNLDKIKLSSNLTINGSSNFINSLECAEMSISGAFHKLSNIICFQIGNGVDTGITGSQISIDNLNVNGNNTSFISANDSNISKLNNINGPINITGIRNRFENITSLSMTLSGENNKLSKIKIDGEFEASGFNKYNTLNSLECINILINGTDYNFYDVTCSQIGNGTTTGILGGRILIQGITINGNTPLLISASNSNISNLIKNSGLITISGDVNRFENFDCHSITLSGLNNNLDKIKLSSNLTVSTINNTVKDLVCNEMFVSGSKHKLSNITCEIVGNGTDTGILGTDLTIDTLTVNTSEISNNMLIAPNGSTLSNIRKSEGSIEIQGVNNQISNVNCKNLINKLSSGVLSNMYMTGGATWQVTSGASRMDNSTVSGEFNMTHNGGFISNTTVVGDFKLDTLTVSGSPAKFSSVQFYGNCEVKSNSTSFDHCYFSRTLTLDGSKNVTYTDCEFIMSTSASDNLIFFQNGCNGIRFLSCMFAPNIVIPASSSANIYYIRVNSNPGQGSLLYSEFSNCHFGRDANTGRIVLNIAKTQFTGIKHCLFIGDLIDDGVDDANKGLSSTIIGCNFITSGSYINATGYPTLDERPVALGNRGVNNIANNGNFNAVVNGNILTI